MIAATDSLKIRWVPLSWVRHDDQPIDAAQVRFYMDLLKDTDGHLAPPILNNDYTVRDGRHRLLAHHALGRIHARCLIVN